MNKIKFDTEVLNQAIALIATAATFDMGKPKYSTLRMVWDVPEKTVRFSVSDSYMSAEATIGVMEQKYEDSLPAPWEAFLSLRLFMNAVRVAPGMSTTMTIKEGHVVLKSGSFKVECALIKDTEIPVVKKECSHLLLSAKYGELKHWFSKVDWIVAKRTTSPAFTCVHLLAKRQVIVASNITGLVEYSLPATDELEYCKVEDIAIPQRMVAALGKFPISDEDVIYLSINKEGTKAELSTDFCSVDSALVNSQFPTYEKLLNTPEGSRLVHFDKDELSDLLGRLNAVMTAEGAKFFRALFDFDGGTLTVSSVTVGFPLVDSINYVNNGFDIDDKFSVKLDTVMLEKGVRLVDSDVVCLTIPPDFKSPVQVTQPSDSPYTYALMHVV
jgi:DNA polymerase III sliding clamp (beta) subunit (PCNA family)